MKKWLYEWGKSLKSFNRNIRLFILSNVLIQIGMGVFSVMYNLYIRELGLPESVNGSVISMTSLATAIMLIPAGLLSDKIGRKWLLIIGSTLTAILLVGRSIVTAEQPMLMLAFGMGIAWALAQVSGVPFLAEHSSPRERMQLFSIHFALITVSNVVGNLLGGIIADTLQWLAKMDEVQSIQISLLTGCVIFFCGLFPLFKMKPVAPVQKEKAQVVHTEKEAGWSFNFKMIIFFGTANLLVGFGAGLVIPYLNLYFANRFDASNSYIGLILALGSAMTTVAMLIGPMLVKRVGKVRALVLFQLMSIPFLFLTAFTNSLFLASLGFLMRQALMNAGNPIQSAIAMEVVHDKYKGLANSVNQMVFNLGWAVMGLPAAWLVTSYGSYWGYAYAFCITGALYLIASTFFYITFGRKYTLKEESASS
ncbi:MFS transporter [Metasolibacillus meyeri]|uniref:MFS transporter n=1 Tax=Metasolibacillus meyeri TaxID=1071052 RepID=A0AAW9NMT7_9BACL|nr:MFS transporter [Metasolibacillus meyeri]MEC1176953.1 MFS transporter [Metasolibacillus meyeri]